MRLPDDNIPVRGCLLKFSELLRLRLSGAMNRLDLSRDAAFHEIGPERWVFAVVVIHLSSLSSPPMNRIVSVAKAACAPAMISAACLYALLGLLDHPSARFFQEREFVVGRVARNGAPDEGEVARVVECPSISLNLGMEFPDAGHDLVAET